MTPDPATRDAVVRWLREQQLQRPGEFMVDAVKRVRRWNLTNITAAIEAGAPFKDADDGR